MTDLATVTPIRPHVVPGGADMLANPALYEHMQRVAKMFLASSLIPEHLKKNNGADAFLALQIARDRGESPVAVMQNIYFVQGKAGWMTAYMIGRANKSGAFKGRIKWRVTGIGETLEVEAYAIDAADGEECSAKVSWVMAVAEGWTKNAKYKTMADHMLKWRAATMLIRLYCPEVLHGMATVDELEDMHAAGQLRDVTQEGHATTADAVAAILQPSPPPPTSLPEGGAETEPGVVVSKPEDDTQPGPTPPQDAAVPPAAPAGSDTNAPGLTAEPLCPEGAGQDDITPKLVAVIQNAGTVDRVRAIVKANADRTKAWTQANRAKISIAADDRLEDLQRP